MEDRYFGRAPLLAKLKDTELTLTKKKNLFNSVSVFELAGSDFN